MERSSLNRDEPTKLHVIAVGPFGQAVSEYLSVLHPHVHRTVWNWTKPLTRETWPTSSAEVIVAWRPVPQLCELVSVISHDRAVPFIPLILDSGVLRLGPIIIPESSACWKCWIMRSRQHSPNPQERSALLTFYDANPEAGPAGYLEPLAMLAAAQIKRAFQLCLHPDQVGGDIWEINLFSSQVRTGRLLGVDGCPVCGLNRSLETRTYLEAKRELAFLWEGS